MKKILLGSLGLSALLLLSFLGYRGVNRQRKLSATEGTYQTMPAFEFFKLNGQKFTSSVIDNDLATVIIYFSPDCDHCQYEAKELVANKNRFKNTNILMISPATADQISAFYKNYHLDELPHADVLNDKEYKFSTYFGSIIFPTVLIYDKKGDLKKKYKGEVKIEAILNQAE
jgi:peroxiredoxin